MLHVDDMTPNVGAPPAGKAQRSVGKLRAAFITSIFDKYTSLAIQVIGVVILSRLLTPKDIGIYSIGASFTMIAHLFRDFGVSKYVIQEAELSKERVGTAILFTALTSWVAGLAVAGLSSPLAMFYGEPGLRNVILVISGNFFVIPFGALAPSLLKREMRFTAVLRINFVSTFIHTATGITLAFLGYGYMSMAWASLAGVVGTSLMSIALLPKVWRVRPSMKEWRRVLNFGYYATLSNFVMILAKIAPDMIIGKIIDVASVGIYSKAKAIVSLFDQTVLSAIAPVIMPAVAMKHREGSQTKPFFLRGLAQLSAVGWTSFAFLGIMAFPMVRILFGSQWDFAVPLARVLCLAASIEILFTFAGSVLFAVGRVKETFRLQFASKLVAIALIFASAFAGLEWVALSAVAYSSVEAILAYRTLARALQFDFAELLNALGKSFVASALAAVGPVVTVMTMTVDANHIWLPTIVAAASTCSIWLAAVFLIRHPVLEEISLLYGVLRSRLQRT